MSPLPRLRASRCGFFALAAFCLAVVPVVAIAQREPYETPLPAPQAEDLLPAELLEGPHHTIEPEGRSDGFMAYFTIQSDFGTYKTGSVEETLTRVREIYAIAALDEMKRHELVGEGVVEGVKQPFLAAKRVVTRPGETVRNLGDGMGRWIGRGRLSLRKLRKKGEKAVGAASDWRQERRAGESAEQEVRARAVAEGRDPDTEVAAYRERQRSAAAADPAAETDARRKQEQIQSALGTVKKATLRFLGYDTARRQLAQGLGVDPYSTNIQLQERLDAAAWALWSGGFGTGFVLPSTDLLNQVQTVDSLVWQQHPKDLEVENRKQMRRMGVSATTVDAFFENQSYTTSDRAHMVVDMTTLRGVRNRDHLFRMAATAEDALLAGYYRRSARMLARAHATRALRSIAASSERLVAAERVDGSAVWILAADYLAWTEDLDLVIGAVRRELRTEGFEGSLKLLLAGGLTPAAQRGVEAHDWTIQARVLAP